MTLRRDFLAFTAGAVAARTVLPAVAQGVPVPASTPPVGEVADRDELLERYSAWLDGERLALMQELYPDLDPTEAARFVPADVFVRRWWDAPPPSGRALAVLQAANVYTGPDTSAARTATYPARNPDADLLTACATFDKLQHAFDAIPGTHPSGSPEEAACDAERRQIGNEQEALADRICALQANTRAGLAARARSLVLWDKELHEVNGGQINERLISAIVRDLLAEQQGRLSLA